MRKLIWKIAVGILAVLAIAVLGVMLTFTSGTLELPQVEVGDLPSASPPPTLSISALPTGTNKTRAALSFRGGSWGDIRFFATTALLVRHPKGNLLIDAGMGKRVDEHFLLIPSMQRKGTDYQKGIPTVTQLAAGGIRPADLAGVIPTHAHWDHTGGLDDFGEVPVLVHAAAKRYIDGKPEGMEVLNSFRPHYQIYDFEGGSYFGFPRSHDVFGDGSVVIVPAPGHTPDSVVVFVNLPSGARYALLGDLVFQMEGIEIPAEKPWMLRRLIGEDDAEVHRDIALVRAAGKKYPQLHLLPAHDGSAFGALPVFPASAR
jgi:glyoxylase-like metal-dependent hydrolase (beta-lactamase superfamily II)